MNAPPSGWNSKFTGLSNAFILANSAVNDTFRYANLLRNSLKTTLKCLGLIEGTKQAEYIGVLVKKLPPKFILFWPSQGKVQTAKILLIDYHRELGEEIKTLEHATVKNDRKLRVKQEEWYNVSDAISALENKTAGPRLREYLEGVRKLLIVPIPPVDPTTLAAPAKAEQAGAEGEAGLIVAPDSP